MRTLTEKLTRVIEKAHRLNLNRTQKTLEEYLAYLFSVEQDMKSRDLTYYLAAVDNFEKEMDAAEQNIQANLQGANDPAYKPSIDDYLSNQLLEVRAALKRSEELDKVLIDNIRKKKGSRPEVQQFGQDEQAYKALLREKSEELDLAALKERNRRKALLLEKHYGVKRLPELDNHGLGSKIFDAIKNLFNVFADPKHTEKDMQNAAAPMIGMFIEYFFSMLGKMFKGLFGEKRAKEVDQVVGVGQSIMNGLVMNAFNEGQKAAEANDADNNNDGPGDPGAAPAAELLAAGPKPVTPLRNAHSLPAYLPAHAPVMASRAPTLPPRHT